ncbi:hypothetical protein JCM10212_001129 [Sporobolomyces blumeae]
MRAELRTESPSISTDAELDDKISGFIADERVAWAVTTAGFIMDQTPSNEAIHRRQDHQYTNPFGQLLLFETAIDWDDLRGMRSAGPWWTRLQHNLLIFYTLLTRMFGPEPVDRTSLIKFARRARDRVILNLPHPDSVSSDVLEHLIDLVATLHVVSDLEMENAMARYGMKAK